MNEVKVALDEKANIDHVADIKSYIEFNSKEHSAFVEAAIASTATLEQIHQLWAALDQRLFPAYFLRFAVPQLDFHGLSPNFPDLPSYEDLRHTIL